MVAPTWPPQVGAVTPLERGDPFPGDPFFGFSEQQLAIDAIGVSSADAAALLKNSYPENPLGL